MPGKIGRLGILATLSMLLLLGMVLVASSYPQVGAVCENGIPLAASNYPPVPQSVVEDAAQAARSLFGNSQAKYEGFVSQTLALYSEAKDKDFIILFNPGGWGERFLKDAPGWSSIVRGIQSELSGLGYRWALLDYLRTPKSWGARLDEMAEMMDSYPTKAQDLASRVEVLTSNLPDLRIILAGESTGSILTDSVMTLLQGNEQVYSIQTGPPFWHKVANGERTLVLTSNGIIPDSFSQGDFLAIIRSNVMALFRLPQPVDAGNVLNRVRAPGHVYWWQYPEVYSTITDFLEQNFGINLK